MSQNTKYFARCPRCGGRSFENLDTYSHCVNCLFIHDRIDEHVEDQKEFLTKWLSLKNL